MSVTQPTTEKIPHFSWTKLQQTSHPPTHGNSESLMMPWRGALGLGELSPGGQDTLTWHGTAAIGVPVSLAPRQPRWALALQTCDTRAEPQTLPSQGTNSSSRTPRGTAAPGLHLRQLRDSQPKERRDLSEGSFALRVRSAQASQLVAGGS